MIIRILGGILGAFFIAASIFILFEEKENMFMAINGIFLGLIFLIYGISGKNVVSLIMQNLSRGK